MKKTILISLGIFGTLFLLALGGVYYLSLDLEGNESIQIETINLSSVEDGTYVGYYESGRFSNKVEVEVENHAIVRITLIDSVRFDRTDITDALIKQIIEKQTLEVDIEAGATITSNSYLKSIENALREGVSYE